MCSLVRVNYKQYQLRMCESESFTSLTVQKWVTSQEYLPNFRSMILIFCNYNQAFVGHKRKWNGRTVMFSIRKRWDGRGNEHAGSTFAGETIVKETQSTEKGKTVSTNQGCYTIISKMVSTKIHFPNLSCFVK